GLHVTVVDDVVRRLGNRSARHVVERSSLLANDILLRMGDAYRGQLPEVEGKKDLKGIEGQEAI
ncbi:MAG: hypothetical protein N2C12_18460, partial [Planctomycetales bacterium]